MASSNAGTPMEEDRQGESSSASMEEEEAGASNPFSALGTLEASGGDGDSGIVEACDDSAPRLVAALLGTAQGPSLTPEQLDTDAVLEDQLQSLLMDMLLNANSAKIPDQLNPVQGAFNESLSLVDGSKELGMWQLLLRIHANICRETHEQNVEVEGRILRILRNLVLSHINLLLSGCLTSSRDVSRYLLIGGLIRDELSTALLHDLATLSQASGGDFTAMFTDVAEGLASWANFVSLADDSFRGPLRVLRALCDLRVPGTKLRPFCSLLVRHRLWLGSQSGVKGEGREFGRSALLGPFFSLSIFLEDGAGKVADFFFPDGCDDESAKMAFAPLRNNLQLLADELHKVLHAVLVNADSRQGALDFFTKALATNDRKAQMQADDSLVASDAFALNVSAVLYLLSDKITLDKVNVNYPFHPRSRVNITDQARLDMDQAGADEFHKSADTSGEVNFATECFFLCVHAQRLGINPALNRHGRRLHHIRDLQQKIKELEGSPGTASNPAAQRKLRGYKGQLAQMEKSKWCGEAWLVEPGLLGRALAFSSKQLGLLIGLLCGGTRGALPAEGTRAPDAFRAMPNFYLEDPLDLVLALQRSQPQVFLESPETMALLPHMVALVCATAHVKSPFLASKAIEILYGLAPRTQPANERLWLSVTQLATLPPFQPHSLFRAMMNFYADCESTGSHTEFYDKFTFRYHIQIIFSCLWKNGIQRHIMLEQIKACGPEFVKFVSMVINDTTFLLDESLQALTQMNEVEGRMAKPAEWAALSAEDRQSQTSLLAQEQRQARSYLQLARETLSMFGYITADLPGPFLDPLLGKRLAAMLNYNMAVLCGPKCQNLKVKNRERVGWEPRRVLEQLTDIYLHLDSPEFADFIAADERSYSRAMFDGVLDRLTKSNIKGTNHVERLRALGERAFVVWTERMQTEEDWGEIPEDFGDPIMGTLMREPVRLPSGHVVDREVIQRHLLSAGPINPFNRSPLTEEQLVLDTELKARIDAWVLEKKNAKSP